MKNITKTKKRLLVALFLPSLLALTVFTGCWENTDIRPFADPNAVNTTILEARPAGGWVDNPVLLNTQRPDVLWRAVGDVVIQYYDRFEKDNPPIFYQGQMVEEGRLQTYPSSSSTLFEPWRGDVGTAAAKLQSTLQTQRRFAIVRVFPSSNEALSGVMLEVQVIVQAEDAIPNANAGENYSDRHFSQSNERPQDAIYDLPVDARWVTIGRDYAQEQKILAKIVERLP